MTLSEYQSLSERTLVDSLRHATEDRIDHAIFGLVAEVGEVASIFQKDARGDDDDRAFEKLKGELGDVLWYLSEACSALSIDLDELAVANLEKLRARQERGAIRGSDRGDDQ